LAESPGAIAYVEDWSKRTQLTLAFGQEISVTPLQMLAAFAAVANDGVLVVPRIVRAIASEGTGEIRTFAPVEVRKAISRRTARLLQEFCSEVVVSGTGTNAAVELMEVAGKTGTAQKASRRGGYAPGKFVASFIGFAPRETPKIACLILLDEPDPERRFGGDSAAPVFARLIRAIANVSDHLDDVLASRAIGEDRPAKRCFQTPNFIRMSRQSALALARSIDADVFCQGEAGQVFAQEPDPGVLMEEDGVLKLYVRDERAASSTAVIPDLRGLPIRLAKRHAAERGIRCVFVGSGIVRSQEPPPGRRTARGKVTLYCDERLMEGKAALGARSGRGRKG
jgi:stage V sporulation protein D (sporulation-specific penicillin-binding protein)